MELMLRMYVRLMRKKSFGSSNSSTWTAINNASTYSTATHNRIKGIGGGDIEFFGVAISSVGSSGKALFLASSRYAPDTTVISNNGTSTSHVKGTGSILIQIQK